MGVPVDIGISATDGIDQPLVACDVAHVSSIYGRIVLSVGGFCWVTGSIAVGIDIIAVHVDVLLSDDGSQVKAGAGAVNRHGARDNSWQPGADPARGEEAG